MWLFGGKKRLQDEHNTTDSNSKVEIVAHKKATKQQINKVKKANDALNNLFVQNNFTLTIYLAAGGHSAERLTTSNNGETSKNWRRDN